VIAYNPVDEVIRSGQVDLLPGFSHWLIKFDGVSGNRDKDRLADPQGYGVIEYTYAQMARAAGIEISECRLLEEGGRRHFLTRRFDRGAGGEKIHMQSLGALAHLDFNQPGAHSYEQAFMALRQLGLGADSAEQLYRRMAFNVVARNQDDHVKNVAFLMDRNGGWSLSPAYDLTFSHKPASPWVSRHQMSINGRRDDFSWEDFTAVERVAGIKRGRGRKIVEAVADVVSEWPDYAARNGIDEASIEGIAAAHRLRFRAS
jgi:serine/threonine-protein kinase HipA